jgi:hypothetical protein
MSATTNRFELITLEKLQEIYDILSTSPPGAAVWGTITGTLSSQLDLQAALNAKITSNSSITPGTATKVTYDAKGLVTSGTAITASDLPFGIDASKIGTGTVDDTEFEFLDGVTGYIQTQINSKYDASNPSGYITSAALPIINKIKITDGTAVTGTTANTLTDSILIPANTVAVGDILSIRNRVRKTGTAGLLSVRAYINTSAAIGGANVAISSNANTSRFSQMVRQLAVKSSTNTESFPVAGVFTDDAQTGTVVVSSNIDWTVDQYLVISVQNTSAADSTVSSFIHVQINKA